MKRQHMKQQLPLALAGLLLCFFILLFYTDNQYQTPPPYAQGGILTLSEENLADGRTIFLIDGWRLTDARTNALTTYIGEFSNLQRGDKTASPHGSATYQLILRYSGEPAEAVIRFPALFFRYTIALDGAVLARGNGSGLLSFTLTEGDHLLSVETASAAGYYSGMYHPPMLGTPQAVLHTTILQCIAYSAVCFATLALTLFTWTLWKKSKDALALWFGRLCCCLVLYLSYYFVRLLALPVGEYWFFVQSAALYGLCICVLQLTALSGGIAQSKAAGWTRRLMISFSALLLLLAALVPVLPWSVWLHGILTNCYYIFTLCATLLLVLSGERAASRERLFAKLACTAFGVGLLCNLFASNLFEPILLFWQFEWCALLLVGLFGGMMAVRNQRLLAENAAFQTHLEDLVAQRTTELKHLLQERKAFFADMAHDLKAPVFAAGSFIEAIRSHNTGVDGELLRYIDLVEQKQQEMMRRVQGLSVFNRMDELSEPYARISVQTLLENVYHSHYMAAEVQSIYLLLEPPEVDGILYAQPKKLEILFENLIVNALKFTPPGGKITLTATVDIEGCHLSVADTGSGISPDDVPRLFDRFYVGANGKDSGSGLGLYIVKSIVEELHGEICVSTRVGHGTVFLIDFPIIGK